MTKHQKPQAANDDSAIGKLAKEIAGEIRKGFDAYKYALEAVTRTMLDDVEIERCMREKEIKALRAELADVKYALREQLREHASAKAETANSQNHYKIIHLQGSR
jgi:uncharacterized protein (DUF3084 family)